ncbi:hypothetical protein [Halomicrococcus sp. SG-WS-1]|uniref:hypothetical protein n=1 Tax=Halomicrococcus sp. SG-WS-1 TaxID=3439057 RepID=UPI003F79C81D
MVTFAVEAIYERRFRWFFVLPCALGWMFTASGGSSSPAILLHDVGNVPPGRLLLAASVVALAIFGIVGTDRYRNQVGDRTVPIGRATGGD